jgi:hypothetical protein
VVCGLWFVVEKKQQSIATAENGYALNLSSISCFYNRQLTTDNGPQTSPDDAQLDYLTKLT